MATPAEHGVPIADGISGELVRRQLAKILASDIFSRSERLSKFLRFVVEEALAGRGNSLKEQVVAAAVYGRAAGSTGDEDNAIVRVDARRLRDKLREYYSQFEGDPVIISLPKRTYSPTFEPNMSALLPTPAPCPANSEAGGLRGQQRSSDTRKLWFAGAVAIAISGALIGWLLPRHPTLSPQIVNVTTYRGLEFNPSVSPDGNFVAFAWSGSEKPDSLDIWIKAVHAESLRRLTETPASENNPAWSPDGKDIVFVRDGEGIFVISQLGGPERKISHSGRHPMFTPDGRSVLIRDRAGDRIPAGIFQIELDTLQRRQLTQPFSGDGDWKFEVSPDGGTLAFIRYERSGISDIFTVPMRGGKPNRLTDWKGSISGLTWTPDSRDIIYGASVHSLWRVSAGSLAPSKGTLVAGLSTVIAAFNPSMSRPGPGRPARLVFEARSLNVSLQMIDLNATRSRDVLSADPLLAGTRVHLPGRFSPDGQKIAFQAMTPGSSFGLWLSKRDGTELRQMTPFETRLMEIGSWSPDGQQVVFDAAVDGNSDVYTISEQGGQPQRLTSAPSAEVLPSWSRDRRWIYYSSDRSGRHEVWKTPAGGGDSIQVTRNGGFEPNESLDGQHIFYLDRPPLEGAAGTRWPSRLMMARVDGRDEKVILGIARTGLWALTTPGILFVSIERDYDAIDLYRFDSGAINRIGRLPFRIPRINDFGRVAFSHDGRWALTNHVDRYESDVLMIENFR